MNNKMVWAITACCVGILIGWLMRSGTGGVSQGDALEITSPERASGNSVVISPERALGNSVGRSPTLGDKKTPSPVGAASQGKEDEKEPATPPAWAEKLRDIALRDPAKLEEIKAEMEARVAQIAAETRQAIIDNAKLDDAQTAQLDKVIDDLNRKMEDASAKWADYVREHGTLDADGRLRMMHDVSSVMVSVSDGLDAISPDWRGEGVDFTRLIRVSSLEPFRQLRMDAVQNHLRQAEGK